MTSPELGQDGLPFPIPGIIWDGVTEYSGSTPPGISFRACRLVGDGSRRYNETFPLGSPGPQLALLESRGWESIGVASYPTAEFPDIPRDLLNDGYLDYDGTMRADPVNQIPYIQRFSRRHAARFAHELDAAMGHHTLQSATEEDRLAIIHQTIAAHDRFAAAIRRYADLGAHRPGGR